MAHAFADIAFTPRVRAEQERHGSRAGYARFDAGERHHDRLGPEEAAFIGARDSFYMATVGSTGWPYIQHRGGPEGFVRVLDETTLGFADFRGNRQYVSLGNLAGDDRAAFFFMDYANRARLKLLGRMRATEDPALLARLAVPGYPGKVEHGFLIEVRASTGTARSTSRRASPRRRSRRRSRRCAPMPRVWSSACANWASRTPRLAGEGNGKPDRMIRSGRMAS